MSAFPKVFGRLVLVECQAKPCQVTPPTAVDRESQSGRLGSELLQEVDWSKAYASLDEVRHNLALSGYPADRVRFIKGRFEDTIPQEAPSEIAILRSIPIGMNQRDTSLFSFIRGFLGEARLLSTTVWSAVSERQNSRNKIALCAGGPGEFA